MINGSTDCTDHNGLWQRNQREFSRFNFCFRQRRRVTLSTAKMKHYKKYQNNQQKNKKYVCVWEREREPKGTVLYSGESTDREKPRAIVRSPWRPQTVNERVDRHHIHRVTDSANERERNVMEITWSQQCHCKEQQSIRKVKRIHSVKEKCEFVRVRYLTSLLLDHPWLSQGLPRDEIQTTQKCHIHIRNEGKGKDQWRRKSARNR